MLHRDIKAAYEQAERICQLGGVKQPQAAATLVLANVLNNLPAQTFDIRVNLDDSEPIRLRLGGDDPRYSDPVKVEVDEH